MRKTVTILVLSIMLFWIFRIYSINQNKPEVTYYCIGDTADCGDLELYFAESHLDSPDEFAERFDVDFENIDGDYRMISLCIEVTNKSVEEIEWENIFDFLECGFESSVWASAVDPFIMSQVNRFNSNYLYPQKKQKIWFLTEVNSVCYRDESWANINDFQYNYVLSLVPKKTAVRLIV